MAEDSIYGDVPPVEGDDWWSRLKGSVGGLIPKEEKRPPLLDMGRWGPVLEQAGYGADSPEHKLLTAISGHVNSAPIPKEDSFGQKLGATAFGALGAGLARGAGASVEGALQPSAATVSDWRGRRDMADQGRMKAWETGGNLAIPYATSAVQTAQAVKRAQESAQRTGERLGIYQPKRVAATQPSPGEGSGAEVVSPGVQQPGTTESPPAAAPGTPVAPQGVSKEAAPGVTRPDPGRSPDEPQYPIAPGSTIKFHLPDSAVQARAIIAQVIEENASRLGGVGKSSGKDAEDVLKAEANTPGSTLQKLINDDRAAWQASPVYKGRIKETEAYSEGRIKQGQAQEDKIDSAAASAQGFSNALNLMRTAFEKTQTPGVLGPGFASDWLTGINNMLDRVNLPHFETGPIQVINELSNRIGIETMLEEMAAGNGMKGGGQRMFLAFKEAVANTTQNPQGFAAIMEAMDALNQQHQVRAQAKNEYKQALESSGRVPVLDYQGQQYVNQKVQQSFAKMAGPGSAFQKVIETGETLLHKKQGAGATEEQLSPEQLGVARQAARRYIEQGMSPQEAAARARQELAAGGGGKAKLGAPAPTPAQPEAPPVRPTQPGAMGGVKRLLYDWGPEGAQQRAQELDRIRKLQGREQTGVY